MANRNFSQLPAAGSLTGDEVVPLMQDGVTSQTTSQEIANLAETGDTFEQLNIESADPSLTITDTGAATNRKKYRIFAESTDNPDGQLLGVLLDDNGNPTSTWFFLIRSAADPLVPGSIVFLCDDEFIAYGGETVLTLRDDASFIESPGTFDHVVGDFGVRTGPDQLERLRILDDGDWQLAADSGSSGQVLTSSGAGSPPTWQDASSDAQVNITPDTHPVSPNPANDEFEFGSSIDTVGDRFPGALPWAWVNQGGATGDLSAGNLLLLAPASASVSLRIVEQVAPGGAWVRRAKVRQSCLNLDFAAMGMGVRNSANGRIVFWGFLRSAGNFLQAFRYTNPTTPNVQIIPSFTYTSESIPVATPYVYFQIICDGTDLFLYYSFDGIIFHLTATESIATFLGAVDRVGLVSDSENGSDVRAVVDWFRDPS